ncbi:hypothetical protein quinque_010789 [Culex quinquefasciatus]
MLFKTIPRADVHQDALGVRRISSSEGISLNLPADARRVPVDRLQRTQRVRLVRPDARVLYLMTGSGASVRPTLYPTSDVVCLSTRAGPSNQPLGKLETKTTTVWNPV